MATTTLSSPQLVSLRSEQYIEDMVLHVTPLDIVQTATVTAVPNQSPYVQLTVTWDGATTATRVGQLVKIVSGSTLKGYSVIRKAVSGNTLYIAPLALGDSGYPQQIESAIAVNDTVTVYSHHPLWTMYSRIANKTFYKQWDVPYTDQNANPPPVANLGTWQAAKLATGVTTARFTLPRLGTNTSFTFGGVAITTYAWSLPTGVSFATGSISSDQVITVDAEAGYHLIQLTVTDANGKTHIGYVWLFVSDGTTGASLSERYAVSLDSDNQTQDGREIEFTVTGTALESVLYAGAGILLREFPVYGGSALDDGVVIDTFVGYITEVTMTHDGDIGIAKCKAVSPFLYAAQLAMPPQVLDEKASPSTWAECSSVLSNPQGFLYYAMKWHCPALLDMHDLDANSLTSPRRKFGQYNTQNVQASMKVAAEYIAGNVGSASDGTTVLRKNPLLGTNTERNSITNVLTWQEQDLLYDAGIEYTKRFIMPFAEARSGAFAFDSGKTKAWAVASRWRQGQGRTELTDFTVTSADGVEKAKEVIGHYLAMQNADIQELTITLLRNQDVIDPVYMLWCSLNVSSDFDAYGSGFVNKRMLPIRVERQYSFENGDLLKTIRLTLKPETFGQKGEEVPIKNASNSLQNGWSSTTPIFFQPYDTSTLGATLIAYDDNGKLAITFNYFAGSPQWIDLSGYVNNELVCDACIDYNSSFFTNGYLYSASLGLYIVTTSGTDMNIWYITDVRTSLAATLLTTATMADSTCDTEARISCSETYPSLVIAAFKDATGTKFIRSTNAGVSWSSVTRVGSAISDSNDNAPLGLAVDGQNQLISAPDSSGQYGIYLATTASGSFSAVTSTPRSDSPNPMVQIAPDDTIAYVSSQGAGNQAISFDSSVDSIPFGGVGYPRWGISGGDFTGWTSGVQATGGNPTYCYIAQAPSITSSDNIQFYVWMAAGGTYYTVENITFDIWINSPTTYTITSNLGTGGSITGLASSSWVSVDWAADSGATGIPESINALVNFTFTFTGSSASPAEIRFDNVVITTSTPFVVGSQTLYKLGAFTTSPTWTDISPVAGKMPVRPYDLAIDIYNSSTLNLSVDTPRWYGSSNAGTSYVTVQSDAAYRSFESKTTLITIGGSSAVSVILDGAAITDKTGNLAIVWGSIGTIKRVISI